MDRENRDELIWLYAAGATDAPETVMVRQWLDDGRSEDLATYREAAEAVSALAVTVEPLAPSPSVRKLVMKQARVPNGSSGGQLSSRPWLLGTLAAAASLLLVLQFFQNREDREQARVQVETLTTALQAAQDQAHTLAATQLAIARLGGSESPNQPYGRVFWNKGENQLTAFVFNLTPAESKELQLWVITPDGHKFSAGVFRAGEDGCGNTGAVSVVAKLPPGAENVVSAAITDEPIGGSKQPTGPVRLAGKLE